MPDQDREQRVAAEDPGGACSGLFERASSLDSTGHSDLAVPLANYAGDLTGEQG